MILALDTDVLVSWALTGAPRHQTVRAMVARELREPDVSIGLVPQVVFEFLHVVTDSRRFESPLSMPAAIELTKLRLKPPSRGFSKRRSFVNRAPAFAGA